MGRSVLVLTLCGEEKPQLHYRQWKLVELTVVTITVLNMSIATALAAININVCDATGCVVCEF